MAVSRALRRLLRIRDLEEEQSRLALESALGELHRLEHALSATVEWDRRGRKLIEAGVRAGELAERLAGIEEVRSADRWAAALGPMIDDEEAEVAGLREEFIARRVERRQAETLIQETEARDAVEAGRHTQQTLDDWYRSRCYGEEAEEQRSKHALPSRSQMPLELETELPEKLAREPIRDLCSHS